MTNEDSTVASSYVEVPVEDLGTGIFNILGEMVGGVVDLQRQATDKVRQGMGMFFKGDGSTHVEEEELPLEPPPAPRFTSVQPRSMDLERPVVKENPAKGHHHTHKVPGSGSSVF